MGVYNYPKSISFIPVGKYPLRTEKVIDFS